MAESETTIYFVGTAGAGKSSLVAAYDRWAKQHGLTTALVNLDPGVDLLPYDADLDIRDYVRLEDVMAELELGPNGAQVAAADRIADELEVIRDELLTLRADQVLVDTPGQVELFVFRDAGQHVVENLNPGASVVAYLLDPLLARTPSGFASQLLLAASTHVRFQEPVVHALSKADLIDEAATERIQEWARDPYALEEAIIAEAPSMGRELATNLARLMDGLGLRESLIPASAADGYGIDDLYTAVQTAVGRGEDQTPEYDTFLRPDQADIDLDQSY